MQEQSQSNNSVKIRYIFNQLEERITQESNICEKILTINQRYEDYENYQQKLEQFNQLFAEGKTEDYEQQQNNFNQFDSEYEFQDEEQQEQEDNSRYYQTNLQYCNYCKQSGHVSEYCWKPPKGIACMICLQVHKKNECKNNCICFNCYELGHMKQNCPVNLKQRQMLKHCKKCNKKGHSQEQCQIIDNRFLNVNYQPEFSYIRCSHCLNFGHINCFNFRSVSLYDNIYNDKDYINHSNVSEFYYNNSRNDNRQQNLNTQSDVVEKAQQQKIYQQIINYEQNLKTEDNRAETQMDNRAETQMDNENENEDNQQQQQSVRSEIIYNEQPSQLIKNIPQRSIYK